MLFKQIKHDDNQIASTIPIVIGFILLSLQHCVVAAPIPSTIFDPDEVGWASVRNYTSSQFAEKFDEMKDDYILIDIEVDVIDSRPRISGVWQYNLDNRGWIELRNLTSDEFHTNWEKYKRLGYRLTDQESYVLNGKRRYAMIMVENVEGLDWASYRNYTNAEFATAFEKYKNNYIMIDFEAYPMAGGVRYAAAWVENNEGLSWIERRDLTDTEFSDYFEQYKQRGLRVWDIESYQLNGQQRYAAIWMENYNNRGWYERRNMTANSYRNYWYYYRDLGYRLVDFEAYPYGNGIRYAGVWRQNNDRADWCNKDNVDNLVEVQLNSFDVPGIGVAVSQNGVFRYLRGFGQADVENDIWYNSRTINRLASISKAIGGALAVHLDEQGVLDLTADSSDYIPGLPAHHTHSVGQTFYNRSGIGHYAWLGSPADTSIHYDTALEGAQLFWDQPLQGLPGNYIYSTHAGNFGGATIEAATGLTIGEVLDDKLANPFGLNSFQVEDRSEENWLRSVVYDTDNNAVGTPDDISWKILGGGLESSVYDLARFGLGLIDSAIMTDSALTKLWTPPEGGSYAYGWWVDTSVTGTPAYWKDGNQLGARTYIRLYPDDDLAVVVLSNRDNGGHSAIQLGNDIGALVLNNRCRSSKSKTSDRLEFSSSTLNKSESSSFSLQFHKVKE